MTKCGERINASGATRREPARDERHQEQTHTYEKPSAASLDHNFRTPAIDSAFKEKG